MQSERNWNKGVIESMQADTNSETKQGALNIGIVGLGLIGGSLGRAILKKTPHRVYGRDLSERTESTAKLVRAMTDELTDEGLAELDVLIFAVNPRTTISLLPAYLPHLKDGCIVTDVGGNKRDVCAAFAAAANEFPQLCLIAAHPMAGKEFSGLKHAVGTLFEGASLLMIPVHAPIAKTAQLKNLFLEIGFGSCNMTDAEEHDNMIAYTSQLCHAISLSYCLHPLSVLHEGFSAGSFRDLTRVARLNPLMWAELFCDNGDNLCAVMDDFIAQITALKTAVEHRDESEIIAILSAANERKEAIDKR